MIKNEAFANWDFCGTTITGVISPVADTYINTFPLEEKADFEFKLNGSNTVNSQQCSETAPRESFYATVKYMNGAWKMGCGGPTLYRHREGAGIGFYDGHGELLRKEKVWIADDYNSDPKRLGMWVARLETWNQYR